MDESGKPHNGAPQPTPEQVFREYGPRIYNLARRMLGSDADAEDVTQDVLLQVVRSQAPYRLVERPEPLGAGRQRGRAVAVGLLLATPVLLVPERVVALFHRAAAVLFALPSS